MHARLLSEFHERRAVTPTDTVTSCTKYTLEVVMQKTAPRPYPNPPNLSDHCRGLPKRLGVVQLANFLLGTLA